MLFLSCFQLCTRTVTLILIWELLTTSTAFQPLGLKDTSQGQRNSSFSHSPSHIIIFFNPLVTKPCLSCLYSGYILHNVFPNMMLYLFPPLQISCNFTAYAFIVCGNGCFNPPDRVSCNFCILQIVYSRPKVRAGIIVMQFSTGSRSWRGN